MTTILLLFAIVVLVGGESWWFIGLVALLALTALIFGEATANVLLLLFGIPYIMGKSSGAKPADASPPATPPRSGE